MGRHGHDLQAAAAVVANEQLEVFERADRLEDQLALLVAADELGKEHQAIVDWWADGRFRRYDHPWTVLGGELAVPCTRNPL